MTSPEKITIHIISDAVGETGESVAKAAASQFPGVHVVIRKSTMIRDVHQLRQIVETHAGEENYLFLYTFAHGELHDEMDDLVKDGAIGIDVLGQTIMRLERMTSQHASSFVGALRRTDQKYFDRIDAMEYSVAHDDGRRPDGLLRADVVIVGVSRTSKTPLSMYLAYRGVRTANVPLALGVEPPNELFDCDPKKIFGLMSTPEVLLDIRKGRVKELGAFVPDYADREHVERELEEARALMRKLGCIVINTANRAIEEVAQEILRYVERFE
ncbi:MAG: kinase/pyrophosphorylase [Coriobacteriia bacterium]|nr:kinase/pyrophosphorylase [Coriobacteriia bacterium]